MQELRVAWITDLDAVTSIVNSADIAPFVLEGEAFSAPPVSDFLKYLGVYDGTTLVGVYLFMRRLRYMWEVHTCLTKACRGKKAVAVGRLAMEKLFSELDLECLTTFVPETYLHVQAYTTRMGFKLCGIFPRCFFHENVQDCYLYAITREEALSCLQQQ